VPDGWLLLRLLYIIYQGVILMNDKHILSMSEIMPPEKANYGGNIHGGYILELLDKVAYACAARYSGFYVVTLSVDRVVFKEPIHVGELVHFHASINYVGTSSMEVGIRVEAENVRTGDLRHTNSCYFTMVALDDEGRPAKVRELELKTDKQKLRFAEAKMRREMARKLQRDHIDGCNKLRQDFCV
jgi:acyl-CoA hydrolase